MADSVDQAQFAEDVAGAAATVDGAGNPYMDFGNPEAMKDFKMPSPEDIWKMIEGMSDISDEERENIRENLFNPKYKSEDFLKRLAEQAGPVHSSWDYMIFFAMIIIILLVFALIGYKLYKSMIAKELKKQQKLKSKQSKKTKKSQ